MASSLSQIPASLARTRPSSMARQISDPMVPQPMTPTESIASPSRDLRNLSRRVRARSEASRPPIPPVPVPVAASPAYLVQPHEADDHAPRAASR